MHLDTIQCWYRFKQVLKHCASPLWELERHLHVVLPIANDTEAVLPKLKVQTRAIWQTLDIALDYQVVQSAVRRHQDRQRYARQSARAHAFFKHMNGKTDLASLEMRLKSYFQRQKWTTQNDGNQDLRKVYLLVLPIFITPKVETNKAIQKIYYKGLASNMEFEDQTLLMERCRSQKWPGVTQVSFSKFGRGIVATRVFQKNEVVIDYHGQVFLKTSMDEVSAIEGVKREFCLEVKGPGRRIINASAETCPVHPDSRCMGRLANHSVLEANMKSTDVIVFADNNQRYVVLRASKTVHPFEQLMFDYEDPVARSEFSETQSGSSSGNTSSRCSGSQEPRKENSDNRGEDSDEEN